MSRSHYEERYSILNGERSKNGLYWLCVYCGEPACTRDHVPPISRVDDYECLGLKRELYYKVPCCVRCNTLLGSSSQSSVMERVEHLKDLLTKKNKKRLKALEWDEDEMNEMGKNLRSYITAETKKDLAVKRAIEYYGGYDAILDSMD